MSGIFLYKKVMPKSAKRSLEETPIIPREVLFGIPDRSQVRLSPDGRFISFKGNRNGVANIYVAPREDLSKARPVTNDQGRGIQTYFWSYLPNILLYLQDEKGDENWRIYSLNIKTGGVMILTPSGKVQARMLGLSDKFPEEILVGSNERNPVYHDVYRVNLTTGKKSLTLQNDSFADFSVDHDLAIRLGVSQTQGGGLKISKRIKDNWTDLLTVGPQDALTTDILGFDKSGNILYLRSSQKRNTAALFTVNLTDNSEKLISQNPKADLEGLEIHPKEKNIQAVSYNYERQKWIILDEKIRPDFAYLQRQSAGEMLIVSRSEDDKYWIVAFIVDNGPVKYYLYEREKRKAAFMFNSQTNLEKYSLANSYPLIIKSRDGLDLVCYLTLPPYHDAGNASTDTAIPMVVNVHGGPWARDSWGYNPQDQWLANRGYAVLSVNYRGSTGFGKNFINAGDGQWAGKMHDDLIDAVNWAVGKKIADPNKIAIMGGSYGGFAALVGLTFTPDVFAAGVDIVGPSSLITLMENVPPYWLPQIELMKQRIGNFTTKEGREFLTQRSPLTFADKIRKPLLIGQGANDPRVKQSEADQIVEAMTKKKIPVSYILYPDEGHGFVRPENKYSFYAVAEKFLSKFIGGRVQGYENSFRNSSIQVPFGSEYLPGLKEAIQSSNNSPDQTVP